MTVTVLVVDDSGFYRRRLVDILSEDPGIKVIGIAENGLEAIQQVIKLNPDVVTMDIEMPVMDGITAVRKIMDSHPVPILMFSMLTREGAQATLDALEAGAVDFLPKKFDEISLNRDEAKRLLRSRVRAISSRGRFLSSRTSKKHAKSISPVSTTTRERPSPAPIAKGSKIIPNSRNCELIAIGTSTGGPIALQNILTKLPASFPFPIVLIQHMPSTFTPTFAERLNTLCKIQVKEATDNDMLKPGIALLAPGGKQMIIQKKAGRASVRIVASRSDQTYRPSVDITFAAASNIFSGKVLAIILTGMGADGKDGARLLKEKGSLIWAQDEDSCVVYGMPGAVVNAGLADRIIPLAIIGNELAKIV